MRRWRRVLCALELSAGVLDEAIALGAQLIVTHHPILFRGRKNLCSDDPEGRLLCALDPCGCRARRHAHQLRQRPSRRQRRAGGAARTGERPARARTACAWASCRRCALEALCRPRALQSRRRRARATATGHARCAAWRCSAARARTLPRDALAAGADVYVTGEMGYHRALSAVDDGLCVIEAGHAATESPPFLLWQALYKTPRMRYNIRCACCAAHQELFL